MCVYLQSVKVVHLLMCEAAIVLQINSSNHIGSFATGPNLSLTIDDMSLSCSLDFGAIQ